MESKKLIFKLLNKTKITLPANNPKPRSQISPILQNYQNELKSDYYSVLPTYFKLSEEAGTRLDEKYNGTEGYGRETPQ